MPLAQNTAVCCPITATITDSVLTQENGAMEDGSSQGFQDEEVMPTPGEAFESLPPGLFDDLQRISETFTPKGRSLASSDENVEEWEAFPTPTELKHNPSTVRGARTPHRLSDRESPRPLQHPRQWRPCHPDGFRLTTPMADRRCATSWA